MQGQEQVQGQNVWQSQSLQGQQGQQGHQGHHGQWTQPQGIFQGQQGNVMESQGVPTGIQGVPQGVQSRHGVQQGMQNVHGMQQGVQGIQGVQGLQGVQGVQGVQGLQGVQGVSGLQSHFSTQGIQNKYRHTYQGQSQLQQGVGAVYIGSGQHHAGGWQGALSHGQTQDALVSQYHQNRHISHVIGGAVSLDGKPLGFPLDRPLTSGALSVPNIHVQTVYVYHQGQPTNEMYTQ